MNTENFVLRQQLVSPTKSNAISLNTLKYVAIDVKRRSELQQLWNKPKWWPLLALVLLLTLLMIPLGLAYRKKQRRLARRGS